MLIAQVKKKNFKKTKIRTFDLRFLGFSVVSSDVKFHEFCCPEKFHEIFHEIFLKYFKNFTMFFSRHFVCQ